MAEKNTLQKLLELAGTFVTKQKGTWTHDEWEALVAKAGALGIDFDAEAQRNLGLILEGAKHFQGMRPKKAAAKTESKPKAKAKAKAKAKGKEKS